MTATAKTRVPDHSSRLEEFGYEQCRRCNGEFLRFSLTDGLCDWCKGQDRSMQERHPIDREAARRGFTE